MIDVRYIRNTISDLSAKGQSGRVNDLEFNNLLQAAQTTLFEYYYKVFESTQKILDALKVFIKKVTLPVNNGECDYPQDYVHKLAVTYTLIKNTCKGIIQEEIPVDYMEINEVNYTLIDPIRRPNLARKIVRYSTWNNKIQVYPRTVKSINLIYLKKPVVPKYASVIIQTPNGDFEQYDPINSVHLEWDEQETQNIIDLMLFYHGIVIRENALIEYARLKQKESLIN